MQQNLNYTRQLNTIIIRPHMDAYGLQRFIEIHICSKTEDSQS